MTLDEFKNTVLAQHEGLRALLADLRGIAEMAISGDMSCEDTLRQSARQFAEVLGRHVEDEEKQLEAYLQEGHPEFSSHLADFKHKHGHQRTLIDSFNHRVDGVHPLRRLGEIVETMATAVLLDMEHEERVLFGMHGQGGQQQTGT